MARSRKKGVHVSQSVIKRVRAVLKKKLSGQRVLQKEFIIPKVYERDTVITPEMRNFQIEVYNGKTYIPVVISEDMIGHKFGEFAPTRKLPAHPVDKKLKLK